MSLEAKILQAVNKRGYRPVKPKMLARKLGIEPSQYPAFRRAIRELRHKGQIVFGKNHVIRKAQATGLVRGIFRKAAAGYGFVRPNPDEAPDVEEIFIPQEATLDASTGDEVLVRVRGRRKGLPKGEIVNVLERATRQFVGTYFERNGQGYVRVDGTVFSHSIWVGDPGAKGAKPGDKVVIEMLRFPTQEDRRGEAVITEILGPRGQPGVDTLSIIREYGLPDRFSPDVIAEARQVAAAFDENNWHGRDDFTKTLTITIDPVDARDFDDAVSLTRDPESGHWELAVHIADVSYFVTPGSNLDKEARKRGNSVYLPQRVIPMLPEILSNSLASLQEGRPRFVKSVFIEYTPRGEFVTARFAEGVIRVARRFTYEEVSEFFAGHEAEASAAATDGKKRKGTKKSKASATAEPKPQARPIPSEIAEMLLEMRDLAMILRRRRIKRGALELEMPEAELEYDDEGRVVGAHYRKHDVSHQIIEEFMLAANETVARHFADLEVPILRRVHPPPLPSKLKAFADFARILGYKIERPTDRFALQRVLRQSASRPEKYAVHYAMLRSLKQAIYSPELEGHYALAIDDYCHFTSPIRRYPDLLVHRQLTRWIRGGRGGENMTELRFIGDHCSKTERRADFAERELIKVKLLNYFNERIGMELEAIITGVAHYGFYAQAETLPVEGLVHIDSLTDDYYYYDEVSHSLTGRKTKKRYRLGDKVRVVVVRVDLSRRHVDMRVAK